MSLENKTFKIGYIISSFPAVSQTFVTNEIFELKKMGLDITIFSLRYPLKNIYINEKDKSLLSQAFYSPYLFSWNVIKAQISFLSKNPKKYLSILKKIIRLNYKNLFVLIKSLAIFPKTIYFAKIAQEKKILHIHCHFATTATTAAFIINELINIPYSMTVHAHDIYDCHLMLFEKLKNTKFIVANSEYNKKYLLNLFKDLPEDKIKLVRTGIDLSQFKPKSKLINKKFSILSVGRIDPTKGYIYLLEACFMLAQKKYNFICYIVGAVNKEISSKREGEKIKKFIETNSLQNFINLKSNISKEELLSLYKQADLFVLPCITTSKGAQDGLPSVLVEAMATKVPVISTITSGIPELIENLKTGLIVPQKDSYVLADAIEKIMTDENLRSLLASEGYKKVWENWNLEKTSIQMADLILNSLNS